MLLSVSLPAAAQDAVLRGLVLDAGTHQPIPNAQVGIGGNKLGTSTNSDGRFALRVPAAYQASELEVALLGYRRYMRALPPLPGPELRIELSSNPAGLGTVAITSSATSIIREAVARIAQNYPVRPTRLTGFLRESDEDATAHTYEYLAEGVLLVRKPPYPRPRDQGDVQVLQARKVDLRPRQPGAALPPINWIAGPFIPHRFDFVHSRAEFISAAHFKDYQYRFSPQTTFQGRAVYVITFEPRPGTNRANFAGQLYIDEQSYAFLGAEWHRTPTGIRRERVLLFRATERAYRVDYQRYAGRYHLKSVWYNTLGEPLAGHVRRHLAEYLTTAIDTAQTPPPTYRERTQYADIFLASPTPYDSAFWNHYTISLPPTQLRLDLLAQAARPAADTLPAPAPPAPRRPWLGQVARRLSYTYAAGLLPLTGPGAVARAVVAPVGSAFRADGQATTNKPAVACYFGFGAQVAVTKSLAAYGFQRSLLGGQLQGEGWEAGLTYARNLNPRGRPLWGRVGLGYVRQAVGRSLGTFDNPDADLQLAGTHLAASSLTLALQTQTTALQPKLGLALELGHQLDLAADLGYLLPLRTRSQLRLQETDEGFFSVANTAILPLPAAEAQVYLAGQPTAEVPWRPDRWLLTVGLCYRLQRR
ncbi:carboxypeptidase-like regulatory domain-containing protein [Hymenobacter ginkgonis]|nr:carboxypeptidase-like regulatory domain-containing protein [Hymenobacter ginkgonis]